MRQAYSALQQKEKDIPRTEVIQWIERAIDVATTADSSITATAHLQETLNTIAANTSAVETRTRKLQQSLDHIDQWSISPPSSAASSNATVSSARSRTYAEIARTPSPTVRIHIEGDKMDKAQLLDRVRNDVPSALAVRVLASGDVDVHVPSDQVKDAVMNGPDGKDFRIIRQAYMVEVMGVPLSTNARTEKGEEHEQKLWLQGVIASNRRHIAGLAIQSAVWVHKKKKEKPGLTPGQPQDQDGRRKTRGSLILRVPTRQIQEAIVRKGLVIGAEMFPARLYEHGLGVRQCFKCQAWGHTSIACGRRARCGNCAEEHNTRDCPQDKPRKCTNCKGPHPAWHRKECRIFTIYFKGIQTKRVVTMVQSTRLHEETRQENQATREGATSQVLMGHKRQRPTDGPAGPAKPGRPPYIAQAAKSPSQTKLRFNFTAPTQRSRPTQQNEEDWESDGDGDGPEGGREETDVEIEGMD
jgi:hypothetical protein